MHHDRRLVLVTGCPRSGSTPVGRVLCAAPGVRELYEPFGPTGIRGLPDGFPMPGVGGFDKAALSRAILDMRRLNLRFKPQLRPAYRGLSGWAKRYLVGSRTLYSYRLCKLLPGTRCLLWKDPRAFFCAWSAAEEHAIPVLITVRSPLAHAASFKRMGWLPLMDQLFEIADFSRMRIDAELRRKWVSQPNPVLGAALQWHVVTLHAREWMAHPLIRCVNVDRLIEQPLATYASLLEHVGFEMTKEVERCIEQLYEAKVVDQPREGVTHQWRRTASSVNDFWKQTLDANEQRMVQELNGELWDMLFSNDRMPCSR